MLKRDSELTLLHLLCKQPAVQLLPDSSDFEKTIKHVSVSQSYQLASGDIYIHLKYPFILVG